jgi:hypothetical protein
VPGSRSPSRAEVWDSEKRSSLGGVRLAAGWWEEATARLSWYSVRPEAVEAGPVQARWREVGEAASRLTEVGGPGRLKPVPYTVLEEGPPHV